MNVAGRWRLTAMDLWDLEDIDLIEPAFIEFDQNRTGHFRFIAVEGFMDWRSEPQRDRPRVEFTWEGDDDGDRVNGRGWATLEPDGSLSGDIYVHVGDDSGFRAIRAG